jgi:ribosomal protein S18 acetylase RimI-like enzyme
LIEEQQVRVRPARLTDDTALARLDVTAWSAEAGFPSVFERVTGSNAPFFGADNPPQAHLVAELNGGVVGYIRLKAPTRLPENAHVMQVQGLAVDPSARRRGIAAMLVTAAVQQLRERGTRKLTLRVLSTNTGAIALYERLGFTCEGVLRDEFIINGRHVDDVMMAIPLEPQPDRADPA